MYCLMQVEIVTAAMEYLLSNPGDAIDTKKFEEATGVGITVTPEQIEEAVSLALTFFFIQSAIPYVDTNLSEIGNDTKVR